MRAIIWHDNCPCMTSIDILNNERTPGVKGNDTHTRPNGTHKETIKKRD